MPRHFQPFEALTYRAQSIIEKGADFVVNWDVIAPAIYDPFTEFARTLEIGDTFEAPNGATFQMVWKPKSPTFGEIVIEKGDFKE